MLFALDHANASGEVIDTIAESLCLDETATPLKLARLYAVSDILHNTNARVRNASSYRPGFQGKLKQVMSSFHKTHTAIEGRVTSKSFRDQVVKVLEVWDRWSLYPPQYIQELVAIFLGADESSSVLQAGKNNVDENIDGEALDGEDLDGEDLDGEDLDGEALDGEALDASVAGFVGGYSNEIQDDAGGSSPVSEDPSRKRQKVGVTSKWNDD